MSILIVKEPSKEISYNLITLSGGLSTEKCTEFMNNIHKARPLPTVICMTSPGGSVSTGCAIQSILEAWDHPVTFISEGCNGSMGAGLPHLSNSIRLAYKSSYFIYHNASFSASGADDVIRHKVEFYIAHSKMLDKAMCSAIGLTAAQFKKYNDADYLIGAEEALNVGKYGMIDGIIIKDYQNGTYLIHTRDGLKIIDVTKDRRSDIKTLPLYK